MDYEDKELSCVECGEAFVFTAGEQEFYTDKGFKNEPKRCPKCRKERKAMRGMDFEVVCEECGKQTTVPFKPTGIRPVLCRQCFDAKGESDPEFHESSSTS